MMIIDRNELKSIVKRKTVVEIEIKIGEQRKTNRPSAINVHVHRV